jgi:hypothetical protein
LLVLTRSIIKGAIGGLRSKGQDAVRQTEGDSAGSVIVTSLGLPSKLALKGTRPFGFAALAISLLILSPVAFHWKFPLVFYRFDGTYLLITAMMQKAWMDDWREADALKIGDAGEWPRPG